MELVISGRLISRDEGAIHVVSAVGQGHSWATTYARTCVLARDQVRSKLLVDKRVSKIPQVTTERKRSEKPEVDGSTPSLTTTKGL
jgi:hypothetical protein